MKKIPIAGGLLKLDLCSITVLHVHHPLSPVFLSLLISVSSQPLLSFSVLLYELVVSRGVATILFIRAANHPRLGGVAMQ